MSINNSISLQTTKGRLTKEINLAEKLGISIKDGYGLTVEVNNNGIKDIKNLHLKVDVDFGKLVVIPKRVYEIPYLAAGESTEVHVFVFGLGLALFVEHPLIGMTINSPGFKTVWIKMGV